MIFRSITEVPIFAYDMIMADPPWNFRTYSSKGNKKGAASQYKVMSLEDIKALPVNQIAARDAVLWLWVTNPMIRQGIEVMDAWGFNLVTMGTWGKYNSETGKIAMGTGYRLRCASEPFLIGTVGNPKTSRSIKSLILAPRSKHSEKPDQAFRDCERMMPNALRRIELFSRSDRKGWDVMGDEL